MFKSKVFKAWTLVLQLGISMLVPIFLLIVVAYIVKDRFNVDIMLLCVIFGVFVGARNVYAIIKNYLATIDNDKEKESELMKRHLRSIKDR